MFYLVCQAPVCTKCGSLLSPIQEAMRDKVSASLHDTRRKWSCVTCKSSDNIVHIDVPYSFKYLAAELAAVNVKIVLGVK